MINMSSALETNTNNSVIGVWNSRKLLTLAFIQNEDQVLLGWKKRGFGSGLWNGFGGKVEPGEQIVAAAAREIKEECGLTVNTADLEQFAVIHFMSLDDPEIMEVHVFKTSTFTGDVTESDEMLPKWYPKDKVPYDQMWPDDKVWYPLFLSGSRFQALFIFKGFTQILSYQIRDYEDKNKIMLELKSTEYSLDSKWSKVAEIQEAEHSKFTKP